MQLHHFIYVAALTVASAMSGCTSVSPCKADDCPSDVTITTRVRALLDQHTEFGPPGAIEVQTIDRVVYLNGLVNTGFDRHAAESVTHQAPGVTQVVNSLAVAR